MDFVLHFKNKEDIFRNISKNYEDNYKYITKILFKGKDISNEPITDISLVTGDVITIYIDFDEMSNDNTRIDNKLVSCEKTKLDTYIADNIIKIKLCDFYNPLKSYNYAKVKELTINDSIIQEIPFCDFPSLDTLYISKCNKLDNLKNSHNLTKLYISECNSLKSIEYQKSLKILNIDDCDAFREIICCPDLEHLYITKCYSLDSYFPLLKHTVNSGDIETLKIFTTFEGNNYLINLNNNDTMKDFIDKAKKCYKNNNLNCLEPLAKISKSCKCKFTDIDILNNYTSTKEKYFKKILCKLKKDFGKDIDILTFALNNNCEDSLLYLVNKGIDLNFINIICDKCTCFNETKSPCENCYNTTFKRDICAETCPLDRKIDIIEYCFIKRNLYMLKFLFENKILNFDNYNISKLNSLNYDNILYSLKQF